MASIFRFNQSGVGNDVQYGRQGGHVKYDKTNKRFKFSDLADSDSSATLRYVDFDTAKQSDESLATIRYVKDVIQGMRTKRAVRVASTANFDLSTVAMGEANAVNSLPAIVVDTVTIGSTVRFLLKDQTDAKENGIYIINEYDDAGTTMYYVSRTDDFDVFTEAEGAYVFVESGSTGTAENPTNEGTGWVGSIAGIPDDTAAIGTVDITFSQFHGTGAIKGIQAHGIKVDGNDISMYWNDLDDTTAVTYSDHMIFKGAGDYAYKTATVADALNNDLNIFSHKLVDKTGKTGVHVAADNTANGTVINFNVDKNANHDEKASIFAIDASLVKTEFADPLADGTEGGRVELNAGKGRAAKGGHVKLTAGAGDGVNQDGGDIIFTPGSAGSGTGQVGKVKVTGTGSFGVPSGTSTSRPAVPEAGMIRINTTAITGNDTFEIWNSQADSGTGRWDLIQGAGYQIEDFDKDTYVSVSDGPTGDTDKIILGVGDSATHTGRKVLQASAYEIKIRGAHAIDADAEDGADITVVAGNGKAGGDIEIIAGDALYTGEAEGGSVFISSGTSDGTKGGSVKIMAANVATGIEGGDITIEAGYTTDTAAGNLVIDAGDSATADKKGEIFIGITAAKSLKVGNTATEHEFRGKSLKMMAAGTTDSIDIGSSASTAVTNIEGKVLNLAAGTGAPADQLNMKANTINMGTDTDNVNINIGNDAADIVVSADDLTLTGDNSLELSCTLADRDVNITTSGEGVLHVMNADYTNQVTDDNDIPNRKFVQSAFTDGTFGGIGQRIIDVDVTTIGDTPVAITTLPAGARVRSVTVDVYEAFVWATTGHEIKMNTGAGSLQDVVVAEDTDIETVGVYKIEHAGRLQSTGDLTLTFLDSITPSTATAGKMTIVVEFMIKPSA